MYCGMESLSSCGLVQGMDDDFDWVETFVSDQKFGPRSGFGENGPFLEPRLHVQSDSKLSSDLVGRYNTPINILLTVHASSQRYIFY